MTTPAVAAQTRPPTQAKTGISGRNHLILRDILAPAVGTTYDQLINSHALPLSYAGTRGVYSKGSGGRKGGEAEKAGGVRDGKAGSGGGGFRRDMRGGPSGRSDSPERCGGAGIRPGAMAHVDAAGDSRRGSAGTRKCRRICGLTLGTVAG